MTSSVKFGACRRSCRSRRRACCSLTVSQSPMPAGQPVGLRGEDLDRVLRRPGPGPDRPGSGSPPAPRRGSVRNRPARRSAPIRIMSSGQPASARRHRAARAVRARRMRRRRWRSSRWRTRAHRRRRCRCRSGTPPARRRLAPCPAGAWRGWWTPRRCRPGTLAVLGLHPDAAPVGQQQPGDPAAAQHRAAVVGQVAGQRRGELPRPADRDRPAALLAAERLLVGQHAGAGHIHRLEHLERHPEQEGLDVAAGELVLDHLHRRQLPPPRPDHAARVLGEHRVQRRAEADRGELRPAEDGLDLVILVEQPAVGGGIRPAEARHLLDGALAVQPHGELLAVGEGDLLHRVGLGIAEAVVGDEPELVGQQRRVDPDHGVAGGAGVDAETGQQRAPRWPRRRRGCAGRRAPGSGTPPSPGSTRRAGCCARPRPPRCRRPRSWARSLFRHTANHCRSDRPGTRLTRRAGRGLATISGRPRRAPAGRGR